MRIGDIDIAVTIINLEIQAIKQGKIIEWLLNNNYSLNKPTQADINRLQKEAQDDILRKYPNMGISFNN